MDRRNTARSLEALHKKTQYELVSWNVGKLVAGLDEAGVGPLAGPVVACCVVLDPKKVETLAGVTDSKRMTPEKRAHFVPIIKEACVTYGIGLASHIKVDELNPFHASLYAMRNAYDEAMSNEQWDLFVDTLLIDGPHRSLTNVTGKKQHAFAKADFKSISVAAASVLAKEHRDCMMRVCDVLYPGYGFANHKGYYTLEHVETLNKLGPSPIHRLSYAPVRVAAAKFAGGSDVNSIIE